MTPDLSPAALRLFPCGCVVDVYEFHGMQQIGRGDMVVECPWCASTFWAEDAKAWIIAEGSITTIGKGPRTLLKLAERVLEVVGRCGCGAPYVREGEERAFHLESADGVEFLKN